MSQQVEEVLVDRRKTHGSFGHYAQVSQQLQETCKMAAADAGNSLSPVQNEGMQMICGKLARAMCGDQNFKDHWLDIAGYATRVAESLK